MPPKSIQLIRSIEVIISKNGTSDKDRFMIESGHPISPFIRPRMPITVCGLLSYPRPTLTHLVWLTTLTICWLVTTITLPLVSMYLRADISTLTTIIWSSLCHLNSTMVWLSMKMVPHQVLLRWLMMFQSTWLSLQEARSLIRRLLLVWLAALLQLSTQSVTSLPSTIMLTHTLTDSRCTLLRMEVTRNSEKRVSRHIRSKEIGSDNTHEEV